LTSPNDPHDPDDFDGPVSPGEERAASDEASRREAGLEFNVFRGVRDVDGGPVLPVRLKHDDMFCFSCHKGVSCWNECCHSADVMLTPYDILRLSRGLDIKPAELVDRYAYPTDFERAGLPVNKLKMDGDPETRACVFLDGEKGCSVYDDRPATCRYYPLGLGSIKQKDGKEGDETLDFHFLVKESHCQGHQEEKLQSVGDFRAEQSVEPYDAVNRGWMEILMKMASWRSMGGPGGKEVSDQTKRMFYMVSTDIDEFRRFVFGSKFLHTYEIDPDVVEQLKTNDEALLSLGFDWLKNVMFNEPTISMKQEVLRGAIARTRDEMGAG
jgi:uncharacterized protein